MPNTKTPPRTNMKTPQKLSTPATPNTKTPLKVSSPKQEASKVTCSPKGLPQSLLERVCAVEMFHCKCTLMLWTFDPFWGIYFCMLSHTVSVNTVAVGAKTNTRWHVCRVLNDMTVCYVCRTWGFQSLDSSFVEILLERHPLLEQ